MNNLDVNEAQDLKQRLLRLMDNQKPYLQEEFKIGDLAGSLNVPVHHLSELINQQFQGSFFDFVNRYRVEEAKRQLSDPAYSDKKILAIAFESGFNNKATFNRVFKQFTGMPPSTYRKKSDKEV